MQVTFDQYQRYKTISVIAEKIKANEKIEKLKILEVGANAQKNLGKFLEDEIFYTDISMPEGFENDENFFVADATNLVEVKNDEYDIVVASDVFEHIPSDLREKFLTELYRVSKYAVVFCFPFFTEYTSEVEERANRYYQTLYGEDYIWLYEHIANGLPDKKEINQFLEGQKIQYVNFEHGDIDLWEQLMKVHFEAVGIPESISYREEIDKFYNRYVYENDQSEQNYRAFYILFKGEKESFYQSLAQSLFSKTADHEKKYHKLNVLLDDFARVTQQIGNQKKKKDTVSNVYWRSEEGFSECNHKSILQNNKNFQVTFTKFGNSENKITIPSDTKEVRIDPVEGVGAVLTNIQVKNMENEDVGYICPKSMKVEDMVLFFTNDPQIIIDVREEKEVTFTAEFGCMEDVELLLAFKAIVEKDKMLMRQLEREVTRYKQEAAAHAQSAAVHLGMYQEIIASTSWKVTKPLRFGVRGLKKFFRSFFLTKRLYVYLWGIKNHNMKQAIEMVNQKDKMDGRYYLISKQEAKEQRKVRFSKKIKFSILVPLYNTPENFLKEMIDSVIAQTYGNWELCLADGSDEKHGEVEKICRKYAKKDSRIVYKKLEENLGISGNTNACIDMATGDYIALFDHDDLLHPSALFENMKVIEGQNADFIYTDELTFEGQLKHVVTKHFKPDFSIDNLRANNYICHFTVFKTSLLEKSGKFNHEFDGSQDHDMILRLTEQAENIVHIPKILYFWRSHPNSVAADINSKAYAIDAGKRAVKAHILRNGLDGEVESSPAFPTIYRIKYKLNETKKVSIIIPNCNHKADLERCINSIRNKTTYENYEILVVENNSDEPEIFDYYEELGQITNIRILHWTKEFNYSAINNFAVKHATGEYLLFLNNDVKVIEKDWIQEMLMYAQRKDVAAVGAKLFYEDDTIQHAGIILGMGAHGVAGHGHYKCTKDNLGYMGRLFYAQDVSAVTAACMMIRKSVFEEIGGFEESFVVALNDVDLCMKALKAGYLNVMNPFATLYHYESLSRGDDEAPEKKERFEQEVAEFKRRWMHELEKGDKFYNPNLTLERADFSEK